MIDKERIETLYKGIRCNEEVEQQQLKEKLEENIVSIYYVMDKLEDELSCIMKNRVAEVKEYITLLEKKIKTLEELPNKIREKIKIIEGYSNIAKEEIRETALVADTNSLNYGRKQAHDADLYHLKLIIGESDEK